MYLRQSLVRVPLLGLICNNWRKQESQRFTKRVNTLLHKDKNGDDGIGKVRSLMMLNTDLKILSIFLR